MSDAKLFSGEDHDEQTDADLALSLFLQEEDDMNASEQCIQLISDYETLNEVESDVVVIDGEEEEDHHHDAVYPSQQTVGDEQLARQLQQRYDSEVARNEERSHSRQPNQLTNRRRALGAGSSFLHDHAFASMLDDIVVIQGGRGNSRINQFQGGELADGTDYEGTTSESEDRSTISVESSEDSSESSTSSESSVEGVSSNALSSLNQDSSQESVETGSDVHDDDDESDETDDENEGDNDEEEEGDSDEDESDDDDVVENDGESPSTSSGSDSNNYEANLDLAEQLGEVRSRGLDTHDINRLPTSKFVAPRSSSAAAGSVSSSSTSRGEGDLVDQECRVCLSAFCTDETIRTLPCLHRFHQACIDQWLSVNGVCPVCRAKIRDGIRRH